MRFGSKGYDLGQFTDPWAIAVGRNDDIIVGDYLQFHIFDSTGTRLNAFPTMQPDEDVNSGAALVRSGTFTYCIAYLEDDHGFNSVTANAPVIMLIDAQGNDQYASLEFYDYNSGGEIARFFAAQLGIPDSFTSAKFDNNGNIYILGSTTQNKIYKFSITGI